MRLIPLLSVLTLFLLIPRQASAHVWTFCMKYRVVSTDSNVGEDYFPVYSTAGHPWPALGAKVRVKDPITNVWGAWTTTNLSTGCFTFNSNGNVNFLIELKSESVITNNVTLQIYDDYPGAIKTWQISASPGGAGGTHSYYVGPSSESNLSAMSAWIAQRATTLASVPANSVLKIYDANYSKTGGINGSVFDSGSNLPNDERVFIATDLFHYYRKFLVGHEVSHWLVHRWGGLISGPSPGYNGGNESMASPCYFNGLGAHAMRSEEYATSSFKEGIAHFLSATAWNDHTATDGVFKYYKSGGGYTNETILLDAPGDYDFAWYESQCETVDAGYGVEQDWMRQYWNFLTDAGDTPALSDLAYQISLLYADGTWNGTNVYARILNAMGDLGLVEFQTRWEDLAAEHGVD